MSALKNRLMHYAAAAAAIPAATAVGGIVTSGPGIVGTATPGNQLFVDFGPGIGEVFAFDAQFESITDGFRPGYTFTSGSYTYFVPGLHYRGTDNNALFQFNPFNTGGIDTPGVIADAPLGFTNDPRLLASGAPISAGQAFFAMTSAFGTGCDLARTTSFYGVYTTGYVTTDSSFYGDWQGGNRGFIGFTMQLEGAAHFGWIDVEWIPGTGANRTTAQLIVHGWAYNDEPRGPITAGEVPAPGVFGLAALALGAAGVRRSRRATA